MVPETGDKVRIDKWLWAARLYKTRSMAATAVGGGRVHLNGERVKAAHAVRVGDQLDISRDRFSVIVDVRGLAEKRGPAKQAVLLYEETEQSIATREALKERARIARASMVAPAKRPDKKGRREIARLRRESPQE